MKEIAGLLKVAEKEESLLEAMWEKGLYKAWRKQGQKTERSFFFHIYCMDVTKLLSKWGIDKFF